MSVQLLQDEIDSVRKDFRELSGRIEKVERHLHLLRASDVTSGATPTPVSFPIQSPVPSSLPSSVSSPVSASALSGDSSPIARALAKNSPVKRHSRDVTPAPTLTAYDEQMLPPNRLSGKIFNVSKETLANQCVAVAESDVELQIGKYWLNRIGIGSLVLGCVFLVLYSFQYFGVGAKLATGLLISSALIGGGEFISRKSNRDWYGNALIGGGWSLAYFIVYAMHFIPDLRIVQSFALELLALSSVAGGVMYHALKKNSHVLAMMATLFGLASIAVGPQTNWSYFGYLLISTGAAFLAISKNWISAFYVTLLATFACHFVASCSLWAVNPNSLSGPFHLSALVVNSACSVGAIFAYWSVFNAALVYCAKDDLGKQSKVIGLSWLNVCYLTLAIALFSRGALVNYNYWFFAGAAICYLMTDQYLAQRKLMLFRDTHTLFGLFLLTLAFGVKLNGEVRTITFIGEALVLNWLYLRDNRPLFGKFAALLSMMTLLKWFASLMFMPLDAEAWFGFNTTRGLLAGAFGVLCSAASAHMFKISLEHSNEHTDDDLANLEDAEKSLTCHSLFNFHVIVANVYAVTLGTLLTSVSLRLMWWTILTCANAVLRMRVRAKVFEWSTHILLAIATIVAVIEVQSGTSLWSYLAVSLLYAFDWVTLVAFRGTSLKWRPFAHAAQFITLQVIFQLPAQSISLGLGLFGLANLFVGFRSDSKTYRTWGLTGLGILACRLLFVDLAHENSIGRILSFMAAGAVLLVGSFAYAQFSEKKIKTEH